MNKQDSSFSEMRTRSCLVPVTSFDTFLQPSSVSVHNLFICLFESFCLRTGSKKTCSAKQIKTQELPRLSLVYRKTSKSRSNFNFPKCTFKFTTGERWLVEDFINERGFCRGREREAHGFQSSLKGDKSHDISILRQDFANINFFLQEFSLKKWIFRASFVQRAACSW